MAVRRPDRNHDPKERIAQRIERFDWPRIGRDLDERGWARTPELLTEAECDAIAAEWEDRERFRSEIEMGPRRYGEGTYRYFANPLPKRVKELRTHLYPPLAAIANGWRRRLGAEPDFPARLGPFLARCHAAGQARPTPLLLRYQRDGYNCLHQDRYGSVAFPLQAVILLSSPRAFTGGDFLLVEQRPRAQSRGEAIRLQRGSAVLFPNSERPVDGSRGAYRVQVRHGVSRLGRGARMTLGIIFHDAA
jgi:hypothetical protein